MTLTQEAPAETSPTAPFTALGLTFAPEDVNYETARAAYTNTSFSPENRARNWQQSYMLDMHDAAARFTAAAEAHPDRAERIKDALAHYRTGYLARLNAYFWANSRCASWFIVGPAKFPSRRMEKLNRSSDNRMEEFLAFRTTRLARMLRLLTAPPRATAAERAAAYRLRLERAEEMHARMVAANKLLRDKKLPEQLKAEGRTLTDALMGLGFSRKTAEEIQTPDYLKRIGFPSYSLSNSKAEISRLREMMRRETQKAEQAKLGPVTRQYDTESEGQIDYEEHPDDNRVRLSFGGKPEEATRAILKRHGFKWAPSVGAWQRFLTGEGRYAAQQVLKLLGATEVAAPDEAQASRAGA